MSATDRSTQPLGSSDRSLAAQIYDVLRQRIIEGSLPAGTWLRERELAEEFRVSRIPLREALPQLVADGFIILHPRRGAVVRQLTMRDAKEFFDVRSSLEVLVARLAAQRVREGASVERLREAVEYADLMVEANRDQDIARSNSAIHQAMIDLADNRMLASMMEPISALQLWFFGITTERDQVVLCEEHHRLYEAIRDGNIELAGSLAFAHVERSRSESMPLLASSFPAGD